MPYDTYCPPVEIQAQLDKLKMENEAMNQRILNQCELLEKMRKENERLLRINHDLTAQMEKEVFFI